MKTEAFFVFLIILLGLFLCSFLGTGYNSYYKEGFKTNNYDSSLNDVTTNEGTYQSTYDNYNHYSSSSSPVTNETTFIGPDGNTATILTGSNGNQIIKITKIDNEEPIIFVSSANSKTFTSPSGSSATIVSNNGQKAIKITTKDGESTLYTLTGSLPSDTLTSTQYYGSTGTPIQEAGYSLAYQPNNYNSSAGAVTGPYGNTAYYAQGPQGNTLVGTVQQPTTTTTPTTPTTASAGAVTGPYGNTAYYAQGPQGNTLTGTTSGSNMSAASYDYSNSLPQGIPGALIPPGQEDLYILKSEVVPPVCPACPSSSVCPRQEKCPPCPACARCPEPSFECKKVPNYNAINNEYLPVPVLNDFSGFGM
jgi:hypothetical protein